MAFPESTSEGEVNGNSDKGGKSSHPGRQYFQAQILTQRLQRKDDFLDEDIKVHKLYTERPTLQLPTKVTSKHARPFADPWKFDFTLRWRGFAKFRDDPFARLSAKCRPKDRRTILDRSSRSGMAGESMAAISRDLSVGDDVENVPAPPETPTMLGDREFCEGSLKFSRRT